MRSLSNRERILDLVHRQDRWDSVPAAFFLHFDNAFHRGRAAVEKHRDFYRYTEMDFVKIQFELPFPHVDVKQPSDWQQVPHLDLDYYEPQLEVVEGLVNELGQEAVVVQTLYSPFMIVGQMVGQRVLDEHLQQDPQPVVSALDRVTDSLLEFVREAVRRGCDGFYHSTQGAESSRLQSLSTFEQHIKPTDLRVMREIDAVCRFNILHICDYHRDEVGGYASLDPFLDYPGHIVNCSLEVGSQTLTADEVSKMFGRPFMGGMDRKGALARGTVDEVRQAAREVLSSAPDAFILAADCTVPGTTPWENLKAAIDEAHGWRT